MNSTRSVRVLSALAAVIVLASCASSADSTVSPTDQLSHESAPDAQPSPDADGAAAIAANLEAPWSIAFYEDTTLISERDSGRILELDTSGDVREVGVIEGVLPGGEGGLLGIAVHENYLYAYFTTSEDNRIERTPLEGQASALTLGSSESVLDGIPASSFHNGGRIAFGPDGLLYATTGDAGNSSSAQDRGSLAGKILRMTPEGDVPEDNPFEDSFVYSYGHRNPQGIAWDDDGTLYASEFGQDTWDELNVIEPGGNYGWPEVEGIAGEDDYIDPVQQWEPAEASPSGIEIARGSIWIAGLRGSKLIEVPLDNLEGSQEHFVSDYRRLRDVVLTPNDSLWVLTNNTDGRGDPAPNDDRILEFDPTS